ncbi:MAG: peptidylprolyl isomerase [Thermoanaerobaculia bacterium]
MVRIPSLAVAAALLVAACSAGPAPRPPGAASPSPSAAPATAAPAPGAPSVPAAPPVVLARLGEATITVEEFQREMGRRGGNVPGQYATPEQRRALLDEMLRDRALELRARQAGIDRRPEFAATVRRLLATQYTREQLDEATAKLKVTDEEVGQFYQQHAEEFRVPARIRVAGVFFALSGKPTEKELSDKRRLAETARQEAAALPADAKNLGPVALKYSEDPSSRYVGGELGWLVAGRAETFRLGKEVFEAAFALGQPGELSPVLQFDKAIYFLKLVAREDASSTPIEKLRDGLRNRILKLKHDELREQFYRHAMEGLPLTVDDAALAKIQPLSPPKPTAPETPPPLPPG